MNAQLELWNGPKARGTDPVTSHAAAALVDPGPTERAILAVVRAHGPSTDDDICSYLPGLNPPTVKTARSRLSKTGALVPCGEGVSLRQRRMTKWGVA